MTRCVCSESCFWDPWVAAVAHSLPPGHRVRAPGDIHFCYFHHNKFSLLNARPSGGWNRRAILFVLCVFLLANGTDYLLIHLMDIWYSFP